MKTWLPDILAGFLIVPFVLGLVFLAWVLSIPQQ